MKTEEILALAKKEGFSGATVISTDRIVFDPAFRPYCAEICAVSTARIIPVRPIAVRPTK